jgi:two-component system NtrC family sensor kinase
VQSLLDFARQRPPERHPTSLAALVESVLALQSYSISAGRIELTVDVPTDLPRIDVDRSQLQQVILNLTLNAIQAIRASRDAGRIWITARRVGSAPAGQVRLVVADDGPGIPDAVRSRLFLPFFTTKPQGEGTGLGLSVSFGIVAAHGGTLRFEPRSGGGATFIVELPIGSSSAGDGGPAGAGPSSPLDEESLPTPASSDVEPAKDAEAARARVLVLDDEPAIRAFLTKSLRLAGLEAVTVAHGEDAVERCRTESFAALLVDHRMPGMSGTDVFHAIVAIRPELGPRFVFMSGDVLNPELQEFAEANSATLLAKPFDVDTVNRVVTEVVAQRG